jgi:hypothetical protein
VGLPVGFKRKGGRLDFLGLSGPRNALPSVDKMPLADIVHVNLDPCRLDADYKHGLHFTALPTAWVSGFDKTAELRIGSSTGWVADSVGAVAGFMESGLVGPAPPFHGGEEEDGALDWRGFFPSGETHRFYGRRGYPPLQIRGKDPRCSGAPLGVLGGSIPKNSCSFVSQSS